MSYTKFKIGDKVVFSPGGEKRPIDNWWVHYEDHIHTVDKYNYGDGDIVNVVFRKDSSKMHLEANSKYFKLWNAIDEQDYEYI